MSDLEKLIAFDNIENLVSEETRNKILSDLNINNGEEVEKRLIGKKKEDEFLLFLILLDVCSIMPIDESITKILEEASCDFIIQMKDCQKSFMLEIKHTDKEEYKISSGNLQKRIDYANSRGYELYFAISIKGCWMLFSQKYIQSKNGKITIKEDYLNSELDNIFHTCSYHFVREMKIETIYSKKSIPKNMFVKNKDYGNLISYKLYCDNKQIFEINDNEDKKDYIPCIVILQGLQDELSKINQCVKEKDDFIIITEYGSNFIIPEYVLLLSIINHAICGKNKTYDAHTILKESKNKGKSELINKNYILLIRGIIKDLCINKKVPIICKKGNKCYNIPNSK